MVSVLVASRRNAGMDLIYSGNHEGFYRDC